MYNIDKITVKIDLASKEDLKVWANTKSDALVVDFLAHATKAIFSIKFVSYHLKMLQSSAMLWILMVSCLLLISGIGKLLGTTSANFLTGPLLPLNLLLI